MTGLAIEIAVVSALALSSGGCVLAGVRSLPGELRLLRRVDALAPASPLRRAAGAAWRTISLVLVGGAKDRAEIERNLRLAGYYGPSAVLAFGWVRVGATVGAWGLCAVSVMALGRWSGVGPWLPWAAAGIAYILSKRILGWGGARRRRKVETELPFMLDVLSMTLESGASLDQSFRTFVQSQARAAPIISQAVGVLVADVERGLPYEAALDRWGERLAVPGARELAALFKRNLAHGTELSGSLAAFAQEYAERRVGRARDAVGHKAAQMAVVMMIFFMPALFIVLAGPAFVSLMGTLTGMGG